VENKFHVAVCRPAEELLEAAALSGGRQNAQWWRAAGRVGKGRRVKEKSKQGARSMPYHFVSSIVIQIIAIWMQFVSSIVIQIIAILAVEIAEL